MCPSVAAIIHLLRGSRGINRQSIFFTDAEISIVTGGGLVGVACGGACDGTAGSSAGANAVVAISTCWIF